MTKNYGTRVPAHKLMTYTETKNEIREESDTEEGIVVQTRTENVRTPLPRGYLLMSDGEGGVEYIHPSELIIGQPGKAVRKNF